MQIRSCNPSIATSSAIQGFLIAWKRGSSRLSGRMSSLQTVETDSQASRHVPCDRLCIRSTSLFSRMIYMCICNLRHSTPCSDMKPSSPTSITDTRYFTGVYKVYTSAHLRRIEISYHPYPEMAREIEWQTCRWRG